MQKRGIAHRFRNVQFVGLALLASLGLLPRAELRAATVDIELVALKAASSGDQTSALPSSETIIEVGDSFLLEVWAQTNNSAGLATIRLDVSFDSSLASALAITHTSLFGSLTGGTINNPGGKVDDLGGAHLGGAGCSKSIGLAPQWVRVAIVTMRADAAGTLIVASADANSPGLGIAICGVAGLVSPANVSFGFAGISLRTCTPTAANDATCDGIDDDCDGAFDENFFPQPTTCGVGACVSTGNTACVAGTIVDNCTPGAGAADDATCDNVDDDCDGQLDEDFPPQPNTCGVGACAGNAGELTCQNGVLADSCDPFAGATPELCDGVDNNCNGTADEDPDASTSCDCTANEACVGGTCQFSESACSDPCVHCDIPSRQCRQCVFDLDANGVIAGFDFSFFVFCFGQCYQPGEDCRQANFDGDADGCVGMRDYAGFSGCFQMLCEDCSNCIGLR